MGGKIFFLGVGGLNTGGWRDLSASRGTKQGGVTGPGAFKGAIRGEASLRCATWRCRADPFFLGESVKMASLKVSLTDVFDQLVQKKNVIKIILK